MEVVMAEQTPLYRAFTIIERERDVPFWLNIGTAFVHKDGKGFNVILQALPLNGKLVLRVHEENGDKKGAAPE
jgi:hypothetical protein